MATACCCVVARLLDVGGGGNAAFRALTRARSVVRPQQARFFNADQMCARYFPALPELEQALIEVCSTRRHLPLETIVYPLPPRSVCAILPKELRLPRTDGRTIAARRFRSLCEAFAAELGSGQLTEVDQNLIKQAANLVLAAERFQVDVVSGGEVDPDALVRVSSEARRILGMLRSKAAKNKPAGRRATRLRGDESGAGLRHQARDIHAVIVECAADAIIAQDAGAGAAGPRGADPGRRVDQRSRHRPRAPGARQPVRSAGAADGGIGRAPSQQHFWGAPLWPRGRLRASSQRGTGRPSLHRLV
jgi:hypothetical protein